MKACSTGLQSEEVDTFSFEMLEGVCSAVCRTNGSPVKLQTLFQSLLTFPCITSSMGEFVAGDI
jgi:hypothetical protein